MKRRFDIPRRNQQTPSTAPLELTAPLESETFNSEHDALPVDVSEQHRAEQSIVVPASSAMEPSEQQRADQGSIIPASSAMEPSEQPETVVSASSSIEILGEEGPITGKRKALKPASDSGPFKVFRPVRFAQLSDKTVEATSVADQKTKALGEEVPVADQKTKALGEEVPVADQKTQALNVASRPANFVQPPDQARKEIEIAELKTKMLPAAIPPRPVRFSTRATTQEEKVSITDQETRALTVVSTSTPAIKLQRSSSDYQSVQAEDKSSLEDQETRALAVMQISAPVEPSQKEESRAPGLFQRVIRAGLVRLQEPQPEGPLTRGIQVIHLEVGLGLVPLLALTTAFGLLLISASYYLSIWSYSYPVVEGCFLGGILCMFAPNVVRLLSRTPSRWERICILCILGLLSYFIHYMTSPQTFSSFDDFLHWRTVLDILKTNHLFSVNSMLPVSPYYPGLELITDAISSTTGLSVLQSGLIVTITAHFLMVLALYLFYEHITNSSRMASIAIMIYVTNPHFLFFDTIYSYETLALPLAILMIYILARYSNADKNHRWVIFTAWLVLLAVTITHHMTDYVFDGLLLLWAIISLFRPVARTFRTYLVITATLGILLSLAYAFFLPGNPVWTYLSDYFGSAFGQLENIIAGSGSARPLFTSAVQAPPIWDRLLITGAIALVTFSLPFGLISLQRLHRNNALAVTFGLASLIYPVTQAFRFTSFGTEITDRAAAFLFLPIAYMLTILLTHAWPTRQLTRRSIALISSAILVIFLGNIITATSPNLSSLPGPYIVVADGRSVEPEGINAAIWSLVNLGPDNRIATDRINQMLMSTYGDQRILTRLQDNIDVAPIFYSATIDQTDLAIMHAGQIRYLVVDTRISTALPLEGTYFENDGPHSVIKRGGLTKFNDVPQIDRVFDSGDIVIYDMGAFLAGSGP